MFRLQDFKTVDDSNWSAKSNFISRALGMHEENQRNAAIPADLSGWTRTRFEADIKLIDVLFCSSNVVDQNISKCVGFF
jgi:hypothetical protein